ncbi:hypothetical protein D3C78_1834850 [compost metagenome]
MIFLAANGTRKSIRVTISSYFFIGTAFSRRFTKSSPWVVMMSCLLPTSSGFKMRSMIAPRCSSSIEFTTSSNIRNGRRSLVIFANRIASPRHRM